MDPGYKTPSKFYSSFRVHKKQKHGEAPPTRPIISGSGSVSENISIYVEHQIKDIATQHPAYLQDTPHFLRVIEKIKDQSCQKHDSCN